MTRLMYVNIKAAIFSYENVKFLFSVPLFHSASVFDVESSGVDRSVVESRSVSAEINSEKFQIVRSYVTWTY